MIEEHFIEWYDQGKIAGILHLPEHAARPCPIVIYCPGKNGERFDVHRLAVKLGRRLAKSGIAMLRFDYYGVGLSDGEFYEVTESTKVSNVVKAYETLCHLTEIDLRRVTMLGFSHGARVSLIAARRLGVTNLVWWSPLFYERKARKSMGRVVKLTRHPVFMERYVIPWAGLWTGLDAYKEMENEKLNEHAQEFIGNVLILYGEEDFLFKEEWESRRSPILKLANKPCVIGVPGAGHLFTTVSSKRRLLSETILRIIMNSKGVSG